MTTVDHTSAQPAELPPEFDILDELIEGTDDLRIKDALEAVKKSSGEYRHMTRDLQKRIRLLCEEIDVLKFAYEAAEDDLEKERMNK